MAKRSSQERFGRWFGFAVESGSFTAPRMKKNESVSREDINSHPPTDQTPLLADR